ncbi:hypothetical protein TPHA_0D03990 [Tetrapisispora phaffii CBS 4417]|uniref:PH domain-containing protein n=1 Tax=Tetrapisispora phaffii (strain ATCC 24235 / CBS 4417 / NBRC 1672 / NRRL Y-8282 / UCD 70-5) TaxID=1071381 RepID=G8BT62_TETPH|nr:hypothetical protein TPHA_0D03990 [Tetrapisispora phaffii CBS 4417]CCE63033.1 hypothetical protein TPHA_0D03990 [Tetrapisispora phaffii CBS 4417]
MTDVLNKQGTADATANYSVIYHSSVPAPVQYTENNVANNQAKTVHVDAIEQLDEENAQAQLVHEYPTDLLIDRFTKYRNIIKALIVYFSEIAYTQEQLGRINQKIIDKSIKFDVLNDIDANSNKLMDPLVSKIPKKLQQPSTLMQITTLEDSDKKDISSTAVGENDTSLSSEELIIGNSGFVKFGSGSVQDLQVILKKYHLSLASQQYKISKEIMSTIIPSLEKLKKNLALKIKEIKSLHDDFKTNLADHLEVTNKLLNKFVSSTHVFAETACENVNGKDKLSNAEADPYLLKLQLELQLKRQLIEENYLKSAFINLQSSGMKLEKIVYTTIQNSLNKYSALINSEARLIIKNLCHELNDGIHSKSPTYEWDHFISHHPNAFLNWKSSDPIPQDRKLTDVQFPEMKSALSKCIRAGPLLKSSSLLPSKGGSKSTKEEETVHYFVLTSNYLHEFENDGFFKSQIDDSTHPQPLSKNMIIQPLLSISLNDCEVIDFDEDSFTIIAKPLFNSSLLLRSKVSSDLKSSVKKADGKGSNPGKIRKFLKGSNEKKQTSLTVKSNSPQVDFVLQEIKAYEEMEKNNSEGEDIRVQWKISNTLLNPSELEIKKFKKWIFELKYLSAFNNNVERKEFIEDRLTLRDQAAVQAKGAHVGASNHSKSNKLGKMISNSSELAALSPLTNVNTPAIDDTGNLITIGDRRMSHTAYSHSALRKPGESADGGASRSIGQAYVSSTPNTISSPRSVPRSDYFNIVPSTSEGNTNSEESHSAVRPYTNQTVSSESKMFSSTEKMNRTNSNATSASTPPSITSLTVEHINDTESHPLKPILSNKSTVSQVKSQKGGKLNSFGKWISSRRSSVVSQGSEDGRPENYISEAPIKLNQSIYQS